MRDKHLERILSEPAHGDYLQALTALTAKMTPEGWMFARVQSQEWQRQVDEGELAWDRVDVPKYVAEHGHEAGAREAHELAFATSKFARFACLMYAAKDSGEDVPLNPDPDPKALQRKYPAHYEAYEFARGITESEWQAVRKAGQYWSLVPSPPKISTMLRAAMIGWVCYQTMGKHQQKDIAEGN
jgi:hypothetical protein